MYICLAVEPERDINRHDAYNNLGTLYKRQIVERAKKKTCHIHIYHESDCTRFMNDFRVYIYGWRKKLHVYIIIELRIK